MNRIEKRLRASAAIGAIHGDHSDRAVCESLMNEAASEIEALRAKQDRLREALKGLHDVVATEAKFDTVLNRSVHEHLRAARAVLEETGGQNEN